ncbi:MAG: caspase family protein [Betaproteobacteria bacterium]|nr:caspase family protein [Betaproteobacteria bacterium]
MRQTMTMQAVLFALLFAMMISPVRAAPIQEDRVALVIGNSSYGIGMLRNPVNDARTVANKLESLGFHVILRENLNREGMYRTITEFGGKLKPHGVGLFYYAGHGMQINGRNFLVPVDADIQSEDDVEFRGIDANFVLSRMDAAHDRVNMLVLDACRNNPFARKNRSVSLGLAQMDAHMGTLIAFSTSPGSLAEDGSGPNSIYTRNLVDKLSSPGITVEEIFKQVRVAVARETRDRQIPWESTSLMGDFYFAPPSTTLKSVGPPESALASVTARAAPQQRSRLPAKPNVPIPSATTEKSAQKMVRDYNREGYEIENKARTLTSDEMTVLLGEAEKGDIVAQTTLGWAYLLGKGQMDGRGIMRSNREALKWTMSAAEKGYPVAQNNLGALYMEGVAVKMNLRRAQNYFKLAADQGYTTAQVNLIQVSTLLTGNVEMGQVRNIFQSTQQQAKLPIQ